MEDARQATTGSAICSCVIGHIKASGTASFSFTDSPLPKLQYLRLFITAFVDQAKVETYDIVTDEGSFHIIDWVNMPTA